MGDIGEPAGDDRAGAARADQDRAARERAARERLLARGADALAPRPWQPPPIPPSAVDLVHFALWWARRTDGHRDGDVDDAVLAALQLLPAARAELDQLEVALLFTARSAGLTWDTTAQALGLASRQAGRQRLDRLVARLDPDDASRRPDPSAPAAAPSTTRPTHPDDGTRA